MHAEPRLKSKIWAEALIRRARLQGAFAYLRHHGDDDAGIILVKTALMDGTALVWAPMRDEDFCLKWQVRSHEPQSEAEADTWIEQARTRDPDLWVIEIEDPKGRSFLLSEETMPLDQKHRI